MDQEQRTAAVDADAIKSGVVNDGRFETLSAEIHGFGGRHDAATCTDGSCGHSDHGNSTAGVNFPLVCRSCGARWQPTPMDSKTLNCPKCGTKGEAERAGDMYDGQGKRDPEIGVEPYDPDVACGGEGAIIAIDHDPDLCPPPQPYVGGPIPKGRAIVKGFIVCIVCNRVDAASIQPEYAISKGGGSKSGGKERPQNAVVCTECHLEYCTCGGGEGVKSRRGRRKMIDSEGVHGRSATVAFKVTPPAKTALQNKETAALIDELGMAIMNGMTLAEARERLGLPQQQQPEAA